MKRFLQKISAIARDLSKLHIPVYSGNATFFILLSLLPAAMALLSLLHYLPATVSDLRALVLNLTPAPVHDLVDSFLTGLSSVATNVTVISLTAAGTVWSITRAMVSIMTGLDVVYRSPGTRPLLQRWGISLLCALLLFASILATLLLQVFGSALYDSAVSHGWGSSNLILSVLRMSWPLTLGLLTLVFCLLYTVLPFRHHSFISNVPGALITAIGWLLFSELFGFYVDNFSNYANLYGSLTVVFITMLWMYFCMNLIFYGGLINYILAEVPHPMKQLRNYFRR